MKIRTWLSKDFNSYVSKCGNGKAVPQLELDEKTKTLKKKLDADGKQVVHNLFDDIQKFKDVNSLQRILKLSQDQDIENLSIVCANPEQAAAKSVDYTEYQDAESMTDFMNRLNKAHISVDDLLQVINNVRNRKNSPEKKENAPKQVSPEKDVKKDETKK